MKIANNLLLTIRWPSKNSCQWQCGRTHYLVVGPYLEDGRKSNESKKYQKAEEKNVNIITEAELNGNGSKNI